MPHFSNPKRKKLKQYTTSHHQNCKCQNKTTSTPKPTVKKEKINYEIHVIEPENIVAEVFV